MFYDTDGFSFNVPSNFQMRDEFANRPRYFEQNEPKRFNDLIEQYFYRTPLKAHYLEYVGFISPWYKQNFLSFCTNHLLRLLIVYKLAPQQYNYNAIAVLISGLLQFRDYLRNKILGLKYNFKDFNPSMMPSQREKKGKVKMKFLLSYAEKIYLTLEPEAAKLLPKHLKHKAKYAQKSI